MHLTRRDPSKYYLYHRDHDHDLEDCIQLYDEIEALIRHGHLNRFIRCQREQWEDRRRLPQPVEQSPRIEQQEDRPPIGIINAITGGQSSDGVGGEREAMKKQRTEDLIIFTEEDAQGV